MVGYYEVRFLWGWAYFFWELLSLDRGSQCSIIFILVMFHMANKTSCHISVSPKMTISQCLSKSLPPHPTASFRVLCNVVLSHCFPQPCFMSSFTRTSAAGSWSTRAVSTSSSTRAGRGGGDGDIAPRGTMVEGIGGVPSQVRIAYFI